MEWNERHKTLGREIPPVYIAGSGRFADRCFYSACTDQLCGTGIRGSGLHDFIRLFRKEEGQLQGCFFGKEERKRRKIPPRTLLLKRRRTLLRIKRAQKLLLLKKKQKRRGRRKLQKLQPQLRQRFLLRLRRPQRLLLQPGRRRNPRRDRRQTRRQNHLPA